jgi:A/G-specific adenine glycosylase
METGSGKRARSRARTLSDADIKGARRPRSGQALGRELKIRDAGFFRRRLVTWYGQHKRVFPWRRTRNPYRILVAEVLLQKTQAKQVAPVYNSFLQRFGSPQLLARAPTRKVRASIWSLGLPARAPRLRVLAKMLLERFHGRVPSSEKELLSLKGVGRYTASAVLCFGFGRREAVVDANVIRLLSRYFGAKSKHPRPRMDQELWRVAAMIVPRRNFREYNWAIFDFAAEVCRPRNPHCGECPLRSRCRWYAAVGGGKVKRGAFL